MRLNLNKKNTTKPERVVYEVLKELRIPFRHRWYINGREVDFVIGTLCLEINGHEQDEIKNLMLIESGFTPVHIHNTEVTKSHIKHLLTLYNAY